MKIELVRSGACPSCGAPITFASNAAAAQICSHCRFVIARTDRDLRAVGRVADLVPIASPLAVGSMGKIGGRMFRVAGRMQYDRAGAPGAPWQELYLELDGGMQQPGAPAPWAWLAHAQGNWYLMSLYEHPLSLPNPQQANPGVQLRLAGGELFTISERGARRPISAEGELPFPFEPGAIETYADMSGPNGTFGTLDYGTPQQAATTPPQVYFGHQIDPRTISIDGGGPGGLGPEGPKAQLAAVKCPGCGGDLPIDDPQRSERVVCRYCGMQSDCNQGALIALKKLPMPSVQPAIALGAKGTLRGQDVTVVGFMERGTEVDDEHFGWREYLLYSHGAAAPGAGSPHAHPQAGPGAMGGFLFLLEEDGAWQYIVPVPTGEIARPDPEARMFRNQTFRLTQSVTAVVESVQGEFYWKVEVGETVIATEFEGPQRGIISEEATDNEMNCAYGTPILPVELRRAFGPQFAVGGAAGALPVGKIGIGHHLFWIGLILLWLVVSVGACARAQEKTVLDIDVPLKSSLTSGIEKSVAAALANAQRNQRSFADGGVKTSDLRIGTITSKPPVASAPAVVENLKPRIARCFPGTVAGSFELSVVVGGNGLHKSSEAKGVQGLSAAAVACARTVFIAAQFTGVPSSGATLTIPIQFVKDVAPTTAPDAPAAPAEADNAVFTDPFEVPLDGRNLKMELSANTLSNNYIAADIALVHEPSGTVWEDSVELDYYSGVEGGESWSEGTRDRTLWYSRVPGGKYVLRIDPSLDPARPATGALHVKITSDKPPTGYVMGTFIVLVCLYMISTFAKRAKLVAEARKPRPPVHAPGAGGPVPGVPA